MPTKLLKWQEVEVKRIEDLGHSALVDEVVSLSSRADYLDKREEWTRKQAEAELRWRLEILLQATNSHQQTRGMWKA